MASSLAQRRMDQRGDPDGRDRVAGLRRQRFVKIRRSHPCEKLHQRAIGKNEDCFRSRRFLDLRRRQGPGASHGPGDTGRSAADDRSVLQVGQIAHARPTRDDLAHADDRVRRTAARTRHSRRRSFCTSRPTNSGAERSQWSRRSSPTAESTASPIRLFSYQTSYDALGSQCDPSYTLKAGTEGETGFVTSLANAGDTVLMADYEGEDAAYGVGPLSGYQTLDAIRAAETWLGVPEASTPVGMLGYSGGAVATEFASELAPTYAPHLDIVGVAEGGLPVDLFHELSYINHPNSPWTGQIPSYLDGLARGFAVRDLYRFYTPEGIKVATTDQTQCSGTFAGLTTDQMFKPRYRTSRRFQSSFACSTKAHEPKRNPTRTTVHRERPLGPDRRRRHRHKRRPAACVQLLSPGRRGRVPRLQEAQPLRSRHPVLRAGTNIPRPAIQRHTPPQPLRQHRPRQLRRLGTGTRVLTNTDSRSTRHPALLIGQGRVDGRRTARPAMPPGRAVPADPTAL